MIGNLLFTLLLALYDGETANPCDVAALQVFVRCCGATKLGPFPPYTIPPAVLLPYKPHKQKPPKADELEVNCPKLPR